MSASYCLEPDGTVHVMDPTGCGEFTLCNRDMSMADSGGFEGEPSPGPATCAACKEAYLALREGLRGVRWSVRLVTSNADLG